jgi:hypothetical protein
VAIPTSYTDSELKEYMHDELGAVATALGWSVSGGDYDRALVATLRACGVTDASNASDMAKLEALARREAWRIAVNETAGDFDYSADGGRYSRSQFHEQCERRFSQAQSEAMQYDDLYAVGVDEATWDFNPYARDEDDDDSD